ncbi:MAG: mechanosensitive ion channel family protein [Proteobacteria bacterium]|nr:mechanosensitive ion channel family protein [Pseudomonadota bacterium]
MTLETATNWLNQNQIVVQTMSIVGIIALVFISYAVTKHYIVKILTRITAKTKTKYDDMLLSDIVLRRIAYIAPLIIIHSFAGIVPSLEMMIRKISVAGLSLVFLLIIGPLINSLHDIYLSLDVSEGRPIKGYVQVVKLVIYILGGIIIISTLLGQSPLVLLSGFGAMTAVILLIFRDTILSLLASLQITSNDLVRVGDWIEVPSFQADGDVVDIALHTVKIQNFDKTLTIIPTHKLIDVTFKNWRGMKQSGGRRIKRSLYIDMTSIRFCDKHMLDRFRSIQILSDYLDRKEKDVEAFNIEHKVNTTDLVNGRRLTNVGTFRAYIAEYIRSQKTIHRDMTFIVRQLQPSPNGLPIEIYVFTNDTIWANYEGIQADIFDHILSVIPEFGLRVFQFPTGFDFKQNSQEQTA